MYLSELNLARPSAAHVEHYARIVLEHAVRRLYISAAQQVAELARNRQKDLDTVKQRAEVLVLGATSETLSRRAVLSPSEWTEYLMDYLGQARTDGLAGVSTGLRDLDTMTLGLSPGLYLLAASTGTGKTALAGQIALHVAEHHGPVVFVSMELTDVDLAVRLVSVITNIKKEQLVTGKLNASSRNASCRRSTGYHSRTCTSSSAPATRPPTFEHTPCLAHHHPVGFDHQHPRCRVILVGWRFVGSVDVVHGRALLAFQFGSNALRVCAQQFHSRPARQSAHQPQRQQ